jgi:L-ascorbate metabolism protein UlaG (beta-lactamase superfamily)
MHRQARAPRTQPFGAEAFESGDGTVLRWLGMAGFFINSRGTTLMVDPLLGGFDMPVMIEFPDRRRQRAKVGRRARHAQRQRPLQRPDLSCSGGGDR